MNHDLAVVGGGIVGLSLVCALGRAGLRVGLIEASEPRHEPQVATRVDVRVSAISRASMAWLTALSAWPHSEITKCCPFERMVVWDAGSGGEIEFHAAQLGLDCLGAIVENRTLLTSLEREVAHLANVRWYRPATLEALDAGVEDVTLQLDRGRVRAKAVIGADGGRSVVRRLSGVATEAGDYGQAAVVANLRVSGGHQATAWQRFLPDGPLALLPLPRQEVAIVWSTTPERAGALVAAPPRQFCAAVEEASEGRLGAFECVSEVKSFPLHHHHAREYVRHRVALIGDAAHAIHPLAGQGVNLGILDAAVLADVVADAVARGKDFGRLEYLRPYQRHRIGHNQLMSAAMLAFHNVFTARLVPIRALRGLAFSAADRINPLKRVFIRQATGIHPDLPRGMREAVEALEVI